MILSSSIRFELATKLWKKKREKTFKEEKDYMQQLRLRHFLDQKC